MVDDDIILVLKFSGMLYIYRSWRQTIKSKGEKKIWIMRKRCLRTFRQQKKSINFYTKVHNIIHVLTTSECKWTIMYSATEQESKTFNFPL